MTITLHNLDCTTITDQIPDRSIDLLLTDPPYNISDSAANPVWIDPETGEDRNKIHNQKFDESFEHNWDSVSHEEFLQQMQSWAELWFRKIRPGGSFAVFISDKYISYLWNIMENAGFEPKRVWTWKKPAAVPFNRSVNPVSACEYVLWGIRPGGKRTFNSDAEVGTMIERYSAADKISSILYRNIKDNTTGKSLDTVFADTLREARKVYDGLKRTGDVMHCVVPNTITYSGGSSRNRIHPTEKPVELLEYFITLLSNTGDTVLDTFAGSGSTGHAAHNLERNAILIERDRLMFQKMSERIDKLTAGGLFG